MDETDDFQRVYAFVRTISAGKVATYGQVAACLPGGALTPRQVGAALRFAPKDVPWQRVVGAGGLLPIAKRSPEAMLTQRRLLEQENVRFLPDSAGRVDMKVFQWQSPEPELAQGHLFEEGI